MFVCLPFFVVHSIYSETVKSVFRKFGDNVLAVKTLNTLYMQPVVRLCVEFKGHFPYKGMVYIFKVLCKLKPY